MFWQKTDKEKLMELLEWFLSHNWEFKKDPKGFIKEKVIDATARFAEGGII